MKYILLITVLISTKFLTAQTIENIEKANLLYQKKNWIEASKAYEGLVKLNPTKGDYLYKLATSLRKEKKYKSSMQAYKKSLTIGYKKGRCIYFIASINASLGNEDEALKWVKIGLKTPKSIYYNDLNKEDFKNLKSLSAFKALYPLEKKEATRLERWSTDLDFFKMAFETIHFNLHRKVSKSDWEQGIVDITNTIQILTDDEIVTKLMQLVAKLGDGHTFVRPPLQGINKLKFYPIQLYQFKEGVYVTAINETHKDVVGAKLTHIEGISISEVLTKFKTVVSVDNAMGYKENTYLTMLAEVLHNIGVTKNKTVANFTFEKATGENIELNIRALDFNPALWNSVLQSDKELPLYRSNPRKYFWHKYLPEKNAVYLQLNINFSMPNKDIEVYYNEVFAFMQKKEVKHLILDIRNCPGGNSFNNKPLLEHILQNKHLQDKGNFYTIIGRKTFSAAMNLATDLEQRTNTIFVGEPTGSSPNFVGETNFVELPYSKLNVSISNAYWQRSVSWDSRHWIAPDIFIEPTFRAYKNNDDPVLEFILNTID